MMSSPADRDFLVHEERLQAEQRNKPQDSAAGTALPDMFKAYENKVPRMPYALEPSLRHSDIFLTMLILCAMYRQKKLPMNTPTKGVKRMLPGSSNKSSPILFRSPVCMQR